MELMLKDIIEGCLRKNLRDEERLYKLFYGYVSGVTYRYVKERSTLTELVNRSFERIFAKLQSFSITSASSDELSRRFKGWMGQIAANIAIDYLRSKKTVLYIDDLENYNQLASVEQTDHLSYHEIIALLDKLKPIYSLIFNLHSIEGFSHEEIAVMLNIPASTSRVYLTRARTDLATLYTRRMGAQNKLHG